jgi:DNA topoisomerase-1
MQMTICTDPPEVAKEAGLRYVSDLTPGIRRMRKGKKFGYIDPSGKTITDEKILKRIRSLVIPPAWKDVWICPSLNGHIQATGRDDRNRKQYRYHAKWRAIRDETKYDKISLFGLVLPCIRERISIDLQLPGLSREKVLAAVIRILDTTHMRVGNEEYARDNHSYGLTTLRDKHIAIEAGTIHFHFNGKSGQTQDLRVHDPKLAKIVRRCEELPGQELFQYIAEDGSRQIITSQDVNEYLGQMTKGHFTAKDFRTWGGTVYAALALYGIGDFHTQTELKKNLVTAVKETAAVLGNRPATCKKYYIDPRICRAYEEKRLLPHLERELADPKNAENGLKPEEKAVLSLLEKHGGRKN